MLTKFILPLMLNRLLKNKLEAKLFKGKALIINGPRQVGKTTLVNQLVAEQGWQQDMVRFFNGDDPDHREVLTNKNLVFLPSTHWPGACDHYR